MKKLKYPAMLFVSSSGYLVQASETDQAGQRGVDNHARTRNGDAVAYLGYSDDGGGVGKSSQRRQAAQKQAMVRDVKAGKPIDYAIANLFGFLPGTPRFVMATLLEDLGETELAEALRQNPVAENL